MALNEELSWNEVGMIETATNEQGAVFGRVREAFKGYKAEPVLIPAGTEVYKFNSHRSLARPPVTLTSKLSPWWTPYEAFEHDPGWCAKKALAKNLRVSIREWGRLTSAIREDWNSLEWLLIVCFNIDVYGWFGGFREMPRMAGGWGRKAGEGAQRTYVKKSNGRWQAVVDTKLPGGGTQFYIPNLLVRHVGDERYEFLGNQ